MFKKQNKISKSMVLYLFCFMFAPPVLPINFVIILSIYSFVMLCSVYKNKVMSVITNSCIKKFTVLYIIFVIYWLFVVAMNFVWGERIQTLNYITIFYQIILIIPIMTNCITYIIVRADKLNFDVEQLLIHFILAGAIEAVISLATFISPVVRQFCIQVMNRNMGNDFSDFILGHRVYGFANGLYDLFGWGTGLIAALPLFLSEEGQKKYIWLIPLLLIAPLLNARTGIIMFVGGLVIFLLFIKNNTFFSFVKKIFLLAAGVLIGYFAFKWIENRNPTLYWWVISGIEQFWGTISKNPYSDERLSVLFSERFWTMPSFIGIVFGTGHNLYIGRESSANMNYRHSDVGYVNYLWMSGIVGSAILYGIYLSAFFTAIRKASDKTMKWVLILFGGSIALFNIKGQAFTHCPATALILTILFYTIYENRKVKIKFCCVK